MSDLSTGGEEAAMEADQPGLHELWQGAWPQSADQFRAFVRAFVRRMVRYAFRRLGSLDEAEDVVQSVLIRSYQDRERLKRVFPAGPYLYRMTANACKDCLRARKRKETRLIELAADQNKPDCTAAEQEALAWAELRLVESFIEGLPGRQAEVIRLRVLDRLGFAEIAQILGCSAATVKSRFRYGLQKLKTRISRNQEVSP
ncbi:MAG TPA: RNA polymerase sigma factor [archaeon]|nr:RNA polymerase sigma factor [archaeon]